ncbi:zinc ribbon domain-containing protein [Natronorubrum sulfidifaciens]|nr:zinc ribbon domain-containing protein [Natronorubrum sulfidifaciens]
MSMFERLGEKVERLKQEAEAGRADRIDYRCRACGERFHREQETCPDCGSAEVGRIEE